MCINYIYAHAQYCCISWQQMLLLQGLWDCDLLKQECETLRSTSFLLKCH